MIIQNNNLFTTANTTQGTSTVTGSVTTNVETTAQVEYIATFTTNGPSTHQQVTNSTDRIMIFKANAVNHIFNVPSGGLICDFLLIGGGGDSTGGGGGAGACVVSISQTLPEGECVIYVGTGGNGDSKGQDSYIQVANADRYRAKGGGEGTYDKGGDGGCGAGGYNPYNTTLKEGGAAVGTNVVTLNNGTTAAGGDNGYNNEHRFAMLGNPGGHNNGVTGYGGGGGGIGGVGNSANHPTNPSKGGDGAYQVSINGSTYYFRNYFANGGNNFGVQDGSTGNYYIGGGGGGYAGGSFYKGNGLGCGSSSGGVDAPANTGSGTNGNGNGGSGLVIIRYRYRTITGTVNTPTTTPTTTTTYTHTPTSTTTLSTTLGTPSIELVRGTQGDSNTDYKIGNYNGDFIVKSSVSSVDSDYIRMLGTNGAIYNFTNSLYWTQTSDRRIKENIARASYDMCYDNIDKLELNRFNYIKEFNTGNKDTNQLGFIAQEIKEIFPKAVFTNNYSGADLNIQDMLSIDIGQINYTLYGAVKKLMEINKDKEARLKRLEGLLNIEDSDGSSGNVVVDSSNVVVDSSNMVIDTSNLLDTSSNITIDTSNLLDTPNITIDTSNIVIDTSNLLDTSSNITIDTSNLLDTPNITIDTSNLLDTSNIVIDTSNLLDTSNIAIDTSNILDTSSNI